MSSYVGPAVTTTRRPRSTESRGVRTRSAAATMSSGSARRPLPIQPQARYPSPGSTKRVPRAASVCRFRCTASCPSMFVFIEGAISAMSLLVDLDDLATEDFLLRDGDLLVALLARDGAVHQLTRALAGEDDEFETVLFGCSFQFISPAG